MKKHHKLLLDKLDELNGFAKQDKEDLINYIEELEKDRDWLECLEAAGVDNWNGYDYARELSNSDD